MSETNARRFFMLIANEFQKRLDEKPAVAYWAFCAFQASRRVGIDRVMIPRSSLREETIHITRIIAERVKFDQGVEQVAQAIVDDIAMKYGG